MITRKLLQHVESANNNKTCFIASVIEQGGLSLIHSKGGGVKRLIHDHGLPFAGNVELLKQPLKGWSQKCVNIFYLYNVKIRGM